MARVALMALDWLFAWQAWNLWHGLAPVARLGLVWRHGRRRRLRGHFAWHAWHFATWIVTLRGTRGTYGTGLAPVARLCLVWPPPFAWQAWYLVTSTFTLRGRRGTSRHGSSLCVAGVAFMALDWLRWRSWVLFGAMVAAAVCVAGVALGDIDRHFAWLGDIDRHFAWQAWYLATSTVTLRGRSGTWRHRPSLCVAGVELMALGWLRWRAWVSFGAMVAAAVCVAGVALRRHRPSLCVAGVALRDMDRHFAWQAWHLATSTVTLRGRRGTYGTGLAPVARLGLVWRRGRRRCLRGRRGTWRHRPPLCVAGVALRDMDRHFAWQAWHLWHWAGPQTTCPHTTCPHTTYSHTTCPHTTCPHNLRLSCHCLILVCLGNSYTYTGTHTHAHMTHAFRWSHNAHIHTCIHIHTHFHVRLYHTHTHTQYFYALLHLPSTYICCTRRSFAISLIFPAFPIPSLPFFCCLLEEVDMWGSPALSFNCFCVCFCFGFLLLVVAV